MTDFTPAVAHAFLTELAGILAEAALPVARSVIPSQTLREALEVRNHSGGFADLYLPHFWAVILHDGRKAVYPGKGAKFLVYYVNAKDDPRLKNGYPVYPQDQRRRTKEQFYAGVEENRRREALNPGGGPYQFMVVVKDRDGLPNSSAPAAGTFFFTEGMEQFERDVAPRIVADAFDRMIASIVPRSGSAPAAKVTLRLRRRK